MGIDNNSLRFLAEAATRGVAFSRTITIGRQNFYRLSPSSLRSGLVRAGHSVSALDAERIISSNGVYADELLRVLGAQTLHSADYSEYEQATHIFDMNQPSPPELDQRYTAVVDGGSLEHIFNFPQAITNCMNMVAVGGHFIGLTPANNFFGHGFYQFSAELFFRIFDDRNGFALERVVLVEDDQSGGGWFEVVDPAVAKERVTLMSATPSHLFVQARKTMHCVPFQTVPYQSDYVATWSAEPLAHGWSHTHGSVMTRFHSAIRRCFPQRLKDRFRSALFPGPRSRPDLFKSVPKT